MRRPRRSNALCSGYSEWGEEDMPRRGSIGHIVFALVTFARWRGRIVWIPDGGGVRAFEAISQKACLLLYL